MFVLRGCMFWCDISCESVYSELPEMYKQLVNQ